MTEQVPGQVSAEGAVVGDSQANSGEATPTAKYTDADLDKYKGAARKDGRQAAINELLTKAGGAQSVEDLVAAWEEKQSIEEATRTETEREKQARLTAEQDRDKFRSLADARLIDSELRLALLNAGVPSDRVKAAAKLVERNDIQVDGDNVQGLEDAVKATVESMPWLLGAETQQEQTFTAPEVPAPPNNQGDPNQQMGSWLNQILNQP